MPRIVDFPTLALSGKGIDRVAIYDGGLPEFAADFDSLEGVDRHENSDWLGWQTPADASDKCRTGDLSRVPASDAYMSKFEDLVGFESRAFQTVNSVAGGVPNVGAYLAGSPMAMRRRQRVMTEQAPLAIVVDLTSSGGIAARTLENRGAALLALCRVLSAVRPVTLWAVVGGKPSDHCRASFAAVPLDTAPLDLARAAHVLGSQAVTRGMGYPLITAIARGTRDGGDRYIRWPYDSIDHYRANGVQFWRRALGIEDVLFIAPAFANDKSIKEPEAFVREMIQKYGKPTE